MIQLIKRLSISGVQVQRPLTHYIFLLRDQFHGGFPLFFAISRAIKIH